MHPLVILSPSDASQKFPLFAMAPAVAGLFAPGPTDCPGSSYFLWYASEDPCQGLSGTLLSPARFDGKVVKATPSTGGQSNAAKKRRWSSFDLVAKWPSGCPLAPAIIMAAMGVLPLLWDPPSLLADLGRPLPLLTIGFS